MPPHASRTVFVANIPFDVSEEQLANVFSEAGPVSNVEIKFDPQTGRSKGYAFVQFYDEATAVSAVRNLQEVPVNGRNLRVEPSTDEPGPRRRGAGGPGAGAGTGGGAGAGAGAGGGARGNGVVGGDVGYGRGPPGPPGGGAGSGPGAGGYPGGRRDLSPPRSGGGGGGDYRQQQMDGGYPRRGPADEPPYPPPTTAVAEAGVNINLLPPGQDLAPGQKATDAISKTLAAISPGQMQDVMASMKTLVSTNPDQARQLLAAKPQLAYALFQAMLLMNIVDPSVLQRITPTAPASYPGAQPAYASYPPQTAPAAPLPQAAGYPPYAANSSYRPPPPVQAQGQAQYGAPPPQAHAQSGYPTSAASGYAPPPPPSQAAPAQGLAALPPATQAALSTLPEDQRAMLVQVLQLSPDQVNALDPQQKASIVQLRQQFLGTA